MLPPHHRTPVVEVGGRRRVRHLRSTARYSCVHTSAYKYCLVV
jgi:hypothetical protein